MARKLTAMLLVLALCLGLTSAFAEDYDPSGLLDWYEENPGIWMTVNNDHWNSDPESAPTDEDIEAMLNFALKSQTGIHWTETFFLVVRDPATQQGIIGETFGTLEGSANEGTVTILIMADNILPQEQHATPYDDTFCYCCYNGQFGFIMTKYLTSNIQPWSEGTFYVTNCNEYISLRRMPLKSSDRLAKIPLGATLDAIYYHDGGDTSGKFVYVKYNGQYGFALWDYLAAEWHEGWQ